MPLATLPELICCGHTLEDDESKLGAMREATHLLGDRQALQERMEQDGYLLLRGLVELDRVMAARRFVMEQLAAEGQLDSEAPVMDGKFRPGTKLFFQPELAQKNNAPLQELLYDPNGNLMQFFHTFLGGPVRHFDFTWLRCLTAGKGTPSHCDIVYMGRGTRKLYTAWGPLGEADFQTGGLMVLEGSHKNARLQRTYGQRDVDSYCTNRPDDKALTANGYNGWLAEDPNHIRRQLGERWLVAEYKPGDVVIFCMDLVHSGLDNRSDRLRLSSDSRYQLASEAIDPRWIGDNPPGHSAAGKLGRAC